MLQGLALHLAEGVLIRRNMPYDEAAILNRCGLPLMVKPCNGGSSLGTHKVKAPDALRPALEDAFRHDDEVLCEAFISGRELTCGVMRYQGELVTLPITEIISHRDFFDYAAKYEGASSEVTPARLSETEASLIQEKARLVYEALQCRGIVRVDFILTNAGEAYFLEVNTVPGFSEQSIIPQQLRAAGYREGDVLYELIRETIQE
jgi:D-alanine-D-alanine ligase